jgi:hypothetical protein
MGVGFILGLFENSKGAAMLALLPLLWVALRSRRPSMNVGFLVGAMALVYGGIVYPIVTAARHSASLSVAVQRYSPSDLEQASESAARADLVETADAFFDRAFVPSAVALIVSDVRMGGFRLGETLDYLGYAFIPRVLWADKPVVSRGTSFDAYARGTSAADATSSLAQTAAGELYWNFGIPGVFIGMAGIGLVLGTLWRLAGTMPLDEPIAMLLYVNLLFIGASTPEVDFGGQLVALVYRALVFWPLLSWSRHARHCSISVQHNRGALAARQLP